MTRSKYFFVFCVSFIFGVLIGSYYAFGLWILSLSVGMIIPLIFLFKRNKYINLLLLLFVFFLLGVSRIEIVRLYQTDSADIFKINDKKISVTGVISSDPEIKNGKQALILRNMSYSDSKEILIGNMMVYADRYPEYGLGDLIKVDGKVMIPEDFDGFEYQRYLFSKNIYYIIHYPKIKIESRNENDGIFERMVYIRKHANDEIKKVLLQPHGGIVSAMTLGIESDISDEVLLDFNKTGTRHVISISGLHMTIICFILMYLLLAIGLKRDYAFYFSIVGIFMFVLFVGSPPCAVRAVIMSGMVLFAVKVGRLNNSTNAIIFAAVAMLLSDPNLLRYDVGFQLSFLAVLGIINIFPKMNSCLEKYPDTLGIKSILLITISAQIATLPVVINNFGIFSLTSLFANMLILPLVPMIMVGGYMIMIISPVSLYIAKLVSFPVWLIMSYQLKVIDFFADVSFASFDLEKIGSSLTILYYILLVGILNYKKICYFCRRMISR
ncbi:MAG: ComEC/Rec2 family competence protein [Minisyncoccia bacterium]